MERQSRILIVLLLIVAICVLDLFILLPATSPLATIHDTDGDGHSDATDTYPNDNTEWKDTDGDGYGDNLDKYPTNPAEWADVDNDTWADNVDKFPNDRSEHSDIDGDGVGDNSDAFPRQPSQWHDNDGDGYGDNSSGWQGDAFPYDPDIWANGTASILVTLAGLSSEGYLLLFDDNVYEDHSHSNISGFVVIEVGVLWHYGSENSTQVQLTAISYYWSDIELAWSVSHQDMVIMTVLDGDLFFVTLDI